MHGGWVPAPQVSDMVEFGQAVAAKGGRFLEAPVSGSKVPAETVRRAVSGQAGAAGRRGRAA